jgi:hypothetical protein
MNRPSLGMPPVRVKRDDLATGAGRKRPESEPRIGRRARGGRSGGDGERHLETGIRRAHEEVECREVRGLMTLPPSHPTGPLPPGYRAGRP